MTTAFPKISIITPSYNQGQFLERTILSVLNQNYPNIEIIIIDGGSTDESVSVIKKYEQQLAYWISEKDKGTYDANNKGLTKVTGDFWCIVNSDDILLPNAINNLVQAISEHPDQKWFAGGVKYIDELDYVTGEQIPEKPEPIAGYTFLHGCWISHPTVFLHRDIIQEIGLFEKRHLMDMNYWLRMEAAGYTPFIIPQYLAGLRSHRDCKSANRIKLQEEFLSVFASFVKEHKLENLSEIHSKTLFNTVFYYRMLLSESLVKSTRMKSVKYLITIMRIRPLSVFTGWYAGAIKRILFGVWQGDPLLNEFSLEENKANWSEINV